jgi:RES domain-containing protein
MGRRRLRIAWRLSKAKHGNDLSGTGAAIAGGRWNNKDVPALYLGENPAICCLEHFVNASGPPTTAMVLAQIELPSDEGLYWEPDPLPFGWDSKPADTSSMEFGTTWLKSRSHLGLIVPSAVLPMQRNLVINPRHPAWADIKVIEVHEFFYDSRMFQSRP